MARGASRTYQLKLSQHGFDLFLDTHLRIARLTQSLIAYGTTLGTAVMAIEQLPLPDLAAEMTALRWSSLMGENVLYVGTSPTVGRIAAEVAARLDASDHWAGRPPVLQLYLCGLLVLRASEDDILLSAYARATAVTAGFI